MRYTIFNRIPLYRRADGTVAAGLLWARDLEAHLDYLPGLHLCCPLCDEGEADPGEPLVEIPGFDRSRIHALPHNVGWGAVARNLLPSFVTVIRAARASDVVHSGGAGWPFPLSFYLLLIRPFVRFKWVMLIESSFWRLEPGEKGSLRQRFAHRANAALIPLCLKAADARIFTQDEYRRSLYGGNEATLVYPAVWFDTEHLETDAGLEARHAARKDAAPRVIFPARLVAEKGVDTVMQAIGKLNESLAGTPGVALTFDIMGGGALAASCRDFAAAHADGPVRVRFVEPVAYGADFFDHLRGYDALVVANRKAEQPRIVFDAFSQGLPVIGTRTPGMLDVVDSETAELFDPGDAGGLAEALKKLADDPGTFAAKGQAALKLARKFTHREMHRVRRAFLSETLGLDL